MEVVSFAMESIGRCSSSQQAGAGMKKQEGKGQFTGCYPSAQEGKDIEGKTLAPEALQCPVLTVLHVRPLRVVLSGWL